MDVAHSYSGEPTQFLTELFLESLAQMQPDNCLPAHLPEKPAGRTLVIGAGKAAASMAAAFEKAWSWDYSGAVVTRYGYGQPTSRLRVYEAAHPVPDGASVRASEEMLAIARSGSAADLVICLLSGGGSSLLCLPAPGISLEDKIQLNRQLLASGASIQEINCVRKHLSAIKGGKLAQAAAPARIVTLAISDVPGDDPHVVASGPTIADASSSYDALRILRKYELKPSDTAVRLLERQIRDQKDSHPTTFENASFTFIATPGMMLGFTRKRLEAKGYYVVDLGDSIEGEAREVARAHALIGQEAASHGRPVAILSGGELTVSIRGSGQGGPNREYALALAMAFNGDSRFYAIACDSDGADGAMNSKGLDVAGAIVTPETLIEAVALARNPADFLEDNDAGGFFEGSTGEVITGPTRNNLNDFRCILVNPIT
ncbi:glycerate kinase type-2 family protein [Roseibium sp. M-1]